MSEVQQPPVATLEAVEAKFKEMSDLFNANPEKDKVKDTFHTSYMELAFKSLIEGFDQIESVKRAEKRLSELPALIAGKEEELKAIENDPEYHRRVNREKMKELDKELEDFRTELQNFPNDIAQRKTAAMASFSNVEFYMEKAALVKRLS